MSMPLARAATRRFSYRDLGATGRAALIAAALVGSAAFAYAANFASRNLLFQVASVCALNERTTGSPLPCLEVNLDKGYAALRPPVGRPDTILTPLTPIRGLEDPRARAPDAPNYFALAYDARRWLNPPAPPGHVALAVNARLARSQDQLHVHIGCLSGDFAHRLSGAALGPRAREWFRAADWGRGLEFWTYRTGAKDPGAVHPFRLLADLLPDEAAQARTTLAMVETPSGFVVVALHSQPHGWYASAEDIVEAKCGG